MYLSLETCRQLKEWGCDVESKWWSVVDSDTNRRKIIPSPCNKYYGIEKDYWCCGKGKDARIENNAIWDTYDLRDIICNGELSIKFFGKDLPQRKTDDEMLGYNDEDNYDNEGFEWLEIDHHTDKLKLFLNKNKQAEAEEYLLLETIFNPNNK